MSTPGMASMTHTAVYRHMCTQTRDVKAAIENVCLIYEHEVDAAASMVTSAIIVLAEFIFVHVFRGPSAHKL